MILSSPVLCGSSIGFPFKSKRLLNILCSICKCCSPVVSIASIDKTVIYLIYLLNYYIFVYIKKIYIYIHLRSQDIVGTIISKLILNFEPLEVSTNNSSLNVGVR